ncbi:hypothetical protein [Gimibacter soli]|uniref:Flagellar hook-length control protein FliK n=1 Tax=Gimibacter soli TaxID=3024400 RepID=A0AAE9XW60_9PROT|nr:hypothetical protein [Gimibacter soli]WCL55383.1 hypothetical protein PH603_06375 [Gimibacter soli]
MAEITGPPPPKGTPAVSRGPERVPAASRDRQQTGAETRHEDRREQRTDTSELEALRARDPAVSIAAATAHVAVGDNLKAPIASVDREGRPIIITETATFALRPDAGLKPGDDVTLQVRETGHQVMADLTQRNGRDVDPPVRLQLIVIALHSPASTPAAADAPAVAPLPHEPPTSASFYRRPLPTLTPLPPTEEATAKDLALPPLRDPRAPNPSAARQAYAAAIFAPPPAFTSSDQKAPPPPPWLPGEKPSVTVTEIPGDNRPVIDTGKSLWALEPPAGLRPGDSATLEITRLTPTPEALLTERRGEQLNPPIVIRLERVAQVTEAETPAPPAAPVQATAASFRDNARTPPEPLPWKPGDKPAVTITEVAGEARPVIDTGKSLWALDPPAGLRPGDSATLDITRLTPTPEALLTERRGEPVTPPVTITLERIGPSPAAAEPPPATQAVAVPPPPFREGETRQVALTAHPASEQPVVRIGRELYAVTADRPLKTGTLATIEFGAPKNPAEARVVFLDGRRLTPPGVMTLNWMPPAGTARANPAPAAPPAPAAQPQPVVTRTETVAPPPPAAATATPSPPFREGEVRQVELVPGPVPERAFVEAAGKRYLVDPAVGLKPGEAVTFEIVRAGVTPEARVTARGGEPVDPPFRVKLHGVEARLSELRETDARPQEPSQAAPAATPSEPVTQARAAAESRWQVNETRAARVEWATASEAQVTIDAKSYRLRPSADLQRGDLATLQLKADGPVLEAWLTERRGESLPVPLNVQLAPPDQVPEPLIPAHTGPAYRRLYQAAEKLPPELIAAHTAQILPPLADADKAAIADLVAAQQKKLPPLAQAYLKQISLAPALQGGKQPTSPGAMLPYPPASAAPPAGENAILPGLRPTIVGLASLTAALTQPVSSASAKPIAALDGTGVAVTITPIKALTGGIPASEVTMVRGVRPITPQEAAGMPALPALAGAATPLAWLETSRGRFAMPADAATSLIGEQVRLQAGVGQASVAAAATIRTPEPISAAAAPQAAPAGASQTAAVPAFAAGKPRHTATLQQPDGRQIANLQVSFVRAGEAGIDPARRDRVPGPAAAGGAVVVNTVQTLRAYPATGGNRADIAVNTAWGQFSLSLPADARPTVGSALYVHPQQATGARPAEMTAAQGQTTAAPLPLRGDVALPPLDDFPALPPATGATWAGLEAASALTASSFSGSAHSVASSSGDLASRAAAGGKLTNALLFLLQAAGRGHPDGWLGSGTVANLEKRDSGLLDLLRQETGRALALAADGSQEWRAVQIPFDIRPNDAPLLYMMFRHEEARHDPRDGGGEQGDDKDGADRFLIEVNFSKLGTVQLDGRVAGRRFDLVLRTPTQLPAALAPELAALFDSALAANGFTGRFAVQDGTPLPVDVQAAVAGRLA